MKKKLSYRDKLIELAYIYDVKEIKEYVKSRKNLTTGQLELILKKNKIIIPKSVRNQFSGTKNIVLKFVVLEDGNTGEVRILKGINGCDKCSEAAVIAVKSLSKKFIPGELAGEKVNIWFTVPIRIDFD